MIEEQKLKQLDRAFKRIFAMPISRSTFREIQNAILSISEGNQEESNIIFESLVTGEQHQSGKVCANPAFLERMIDDFSISIRVAKDVFERGEFISLASSDIISQPNRVAFLNRIRRVDGEELHFLTDTKGTLNLIYHLMGRLQELKKNAEGKESIVDSKQQLLAIKQKIDDLVSTLE